MDKKQIQMKEQISAFMAKKDYYDILGIQKTATQADIKKSYKKLALRFHPDKNSFEGAKQVFKKVSNAYSVLINPEQKEKYDKFGPEEQMQMKYRQNTARHTRSYQTDEQFDQFDEIFKAFFGMNNIKRQNKASYTRHNFNRGQHSQNEAQSNRKGLNIGVIITFLLIFYIVPYFLQNTPYYSMVENNQYHFKVKSDVLSTQYFVRKEYFQQTKNNQNFKRSLEIEIDEIYISNLKKTCDKISGQKKKYQIQAYQSRSQSDKDYYFAQAKKIDTSSCRILNQIYSQHYDYVSLLNFNR